MQVTFDIPDAQVDRIKPWVEKTMPRDENGALLPYTNADLLQQFKFLVRQWIKNEVQQHELLAEHETIFQQYSQIDVTDV